MYLHRKTFEEHKHIAIVPVLNNRHGNFIQFKTENKIQVNG